MSDDIYWDWRETPFKVGDRVKFGDDDDQIGVVSRVTEVDGDYNDDTGRAEMIPPKAYIKFDDGEEEHCDGSNATPAPEWYDEEPQFVWQFDDIEVLKDENAASR